MTLDDERGVDGQQWGSWGGSTGFFHLLRMVGSLDKLNGGWWHIVANGGCGMYHRFCGCDPPWVVDHFNDVNWVKMRWWQTR